MNWKEIAKIMLLGAAGVALLKNLPGVKDVAAKYL